MKDIKEIYEGILGDMDDTIARGEEDIEDFNYKEILSMFNIDKKTKYDDLISIIGEDNFLTTQMKKDIISTCCSYDGKVLTINFDKHKEGWKYSVILIVSGKSKRLPPVKVINSIDRFKGDLNPAYQLASMIRFIISCQNKSIDINDYIHKDTNVESITINGGDTFKFNGLIHNNFNFSPRRIVEFNTPIHKIDKTKWPKCELKFTKFAQLCIMLQLTNMPIAHMADISRDHVTGNIIL
jgi:hypothetical protein